MSQVDEVDESSRIERGFSMENRKEILRVCKKCLLREGEEEEYWINLEQYIANLEEEVRVSQEEYERRLRICGQCEKIINGMCRVCGCFVELRCALKVRHCADVKKKW